MSGHSRWTQIKRQKGAADVKRANIFTKLANAITIAAKTGADPDSNPRLRLTIEAGRRVNMPKANVERAIARATGEGSDATLEEVLYEAIGPESIGILIEVVTDNRNRSNAGLKKILQAHGAHLGNIGSASWMFQRVGAIEIPSAIQRNPQWEELELKLIDRGVLNIDPVGEAIEITTPPESLAGVKQFLEEQSVEILSADLVYQPKTPQPVSDETKKKINDLIQALDDHDDVNAVSTSLADRSA